MSMALNFKGYGAFKKMSGLYLCLIYIFSELYRFLFINFMEWNINYWSN